MAHTAWKKAISVVMTLVMVLGMVNIGAFAAETPSTIQNFGDTWYHQDGTEGTAQDWEIHLSKTASPTATKNVYDITLVVETKDTSVELAGATHGAAALILDVSSSMAHGTGVCLSCGQGRHDSIHTNRYASGYHRINDATHLDLLKEAVIAFLDSYVEGAEPNDKRLVSIVGFHTSASTAQYWIDVNDPSNLAAVKSVVENLSSRTGTNIEAGLVLGRNLLNVSELDSIPLANQSLILFSDGNPSAAVDDVNNDSTSLVSSGWGDSSDDLADILAGVNAKKLAVAYNTDADLLNSVFGSSNVISSSAGSLALDLASEAGKVVTTKTNPSTVTDPMGPAVTMISVNSAYNDSTETWDLSQYTPTVSGGVTTYTITYQVEIDPLAVQADPGNPGYTVLTPANGTTTLNYTVGDNATPVAALFNSPNIRGIIPAYTLTVNWVDEDGNPLADSEVTDELIHGTSYSTEQKSFEGYTFKSIEGDAANGTMNSDKEVTYVYDLNTYTLTVNWVDEDGNPLADSEVTDGLTHGSRYSTEKKSFEGYTFRSTEGDRANGTMNSDKEVTYVYELKTYFLMVNWVDMDSNPLATTGITYDLPHGSEYATEELYFDGYTFRYTEGDAPSGIMDADKDVTYVYDLTTYTLTVNWVDEDGNSIAASEVTDGLTHGSDYTTEVKEIEGYSFEYSEGDETSGTMDADKEVTYVYSKNPIYFSLVTNWMDENGNPLTNSTAEAKLEGSEYATEQKSFKGYTFQTVEGDAPSGTMDADKEVTYVYSKDPVFFSLVTNWVDENGNPLADAVTETILEGSEYTTEQKSFEGYTFQTVEGDAPSGTTDSDKTVTYVYSKNPTFDYSVVANYYLDGKKETGPVTVTIVKGAAAMPTVDEITAAYGEANSSHGGKVYTYTSTNLNGTKFTLRYDRRTPPPPPPAKYTLTVNWVDEDGSALTDSLTETMLEGSKYTTEQKSFEGYTFETTEGDAANGTMDSDKTVTYVYSKNPVEPPVEPDPPAPVVLLYELFTYWVTEDGKSLASPSLEFVPFMFPYSTTEKSFEGYELVGIEGGAPSGYMDGGKRITYVYAEETVEYTLTVNRVDENGSALADTVTEVKEEGSEYTTEELSFDGYSLKEVSGDAANGTMDSDKEVTYVYSKNPVVYTVTVNWVDENGSALADTVTEAKEEGSEYTTEELSFDGYSLKEVSGDAANGTVDGDKTVTYVYAQDPVEIEEPDVPLVDEPDPTEPTPPTEGDEPIDIPDDDVPLADVPTTGDPMLFYAAAAAVSGLAWVGLKKKKEDD